nr:MAG TPA: hypothetical protein [Bacteriophage sp.]
MLYIIMFDLVKMCWGYIFTFLLYHITLCMKKNLNRF